MYSIKYGDNKFDRIKLHNQFIRNTTVITLSTQNFKGTFLWKSWLSVIPMIVRCLLSTFSLCWGVYGQDIWWTIPFCCKCYTNTLDMNCPPPSLRNILILAGDLPFSQVSQISQNCCRNKNFGTEDIDTQNEKIQN